MMIPRSLRALFLPAALVGLAGTASADVIQWTNGAGDSNWHNPSNWNLGRVPNSADDVYVWNNGSCGIMNSRSAFCSSLHAYAPMSLNGNLTIGNGGEITNVFWHYGAGSILSFRGTLSVSGEYSLFNGLMLPLGQAYESTLSVTSAGTLWQRQSGSFTLGVNTENNGLFKVEALVTVYSGNNLTVFSNGAFGRVELYPGATLEGYNGYFGNNGLLTAMPGLNGHFGEGLPFYNDVAGVVKVDAAIFGIYNPTQLPGYSNRMDRGAYWIRNGGQLYLPANRWINTIGAGADVVLDGPGSYFYNLQGLSRVEGVLDLRNRAGFADQPLEGFLYNTGTMRMESGCGITTTNSFVQAPSGSLQLEVGASGIPGIQAANWATLDGFVTAYFPGQNYAAGTEWTFLSLASGHSGGVTGAPTFAYGGTGTPISLVVKNDSAVLQAGCGVDFNGDGFLDFFDYDDFVSCFETGVCPPGRTPDFNGDDFADFFDYDAFVEAFELGC